MFWHLRLLSFFRRNTVLCVALIAAAITMFLVPPDAEHLTYFDWKMLACLFCVLALAMGHR